MDVVENCLMEGLRNKRPEVAGGNITMKRKTENLVCSMLEGRGMEELLCLRTNSLLLSQLERGKGRNIFFFVYVFGLRWRFPSLP